MSTRPWLVAVLALAALQTGCATSRGAAGPVSVAAPRRVDVQGVLVLADGRAVPGAVVALSCEEVRKRAPTDREGRFAFTALPLGRCRATVGGTRFEREVKLGGNLLRTGGEALRLVLPAWRRVTVRLTWVGGDAKAPPQRRDVTFDEAVPGGRFRGDTLSFVFRRPESADAPVPVTVDLSTKKAIIDPVRGKGVLSAVEVLALSEYNALPVALRPAARPVEVRALRLRRGNQIVTLGSLLGTRTVVWVGRCASVRDGLKQDLAALVGSYQRLGLRAAIVTTDPCGGGDVPRPLIKEGGLVVLEGGPAARWALATPNDALLILDESATPLWRRTNAREGAQESAAQAAVTHLKRAWPLFAATQQVSVRRSASVSTAEAQRLLGQAAKAVGRGDLRGAHAFLDRVLVLSPDNAEARKQRTLLKAQLGDLTGAMTEVGWWRDAYGDEAADELLDLVQKRTSAKLAK